MRKIKLCVAVMTATIVAVGCSDKWDDHYDSRVSGENLWTAIASNPELSNFAKVVKSCGYDVQLGSSQMYTVFAPVNSSLTDAMSDSLINEYNTEKAQGVKDEDNEVIQQFICNHVALYNKSVSSLSVDSVRMVNGKYQILTSEKFGGSKLMTKNVLYNNGILFTIDNTESYFPNIFEYLKKDAELDSVANYMYSFNKYEFDEENSVPGEIVDGKTVYLDSVMYLTNRLLSSYGHIDSEDSSYMFVAPTNEVWKELYGKYKQYYNYDDLVAKRDSISHSMTSASIICSAFFNRSMQKSINDSALATTYSYSNDKLGEYNPYFKFYRPFDAGGIFEGTEDVDCSNGMVLKASEWRIDEYNTFLTENKREMEWTYYQDTVRNAKTPLSVRTVASNNKFYNKVSNNQFVEVEPSPTGMPDVRIKIPNVFSNVGYDIYVVFVPAVAYDTLATAEQRQPAKVRFYTQYNMQNGRQSSIQNLKPDVSASDNDSKPSNWSGYIYTTNPDIVDTCQIASDYKFPTCSYNLSDEQVFLTIRNVISRETAGVTRTMRIDCIIFKPHKEDK